MYERVMAAHQPNFIPYLGFFDKLKSCDVFIIRDEVLFVERDYHHRNRIRINSNDNMNNPQCKWIKVPVDGKYDYIMHQNVKNGLVKNKPWNIELLREIKINYGGAPFFDKFFPEFEKIVLKSHDNLLPLNMEIINFLSKAFGIDKKVVMASELGLKPEHYEKSDPSEDLVLLCKAVDANVYLSGAGGRGYLNLAPFEREGIKVVFQDYNHPVYPQRYSGFLPFMASVDALFCVGGMPTNRSSK
ncbi:MAG: WbqC family protein [archaeon]